MLFHEQESSGGKSGGGSSSLCSCLGKKKPVSTQEMDRIEAAFRSVKPFSSCVEFGVSVP
jgi:hypothetical protein